MAPLPYKISFGFDENKRTSATNENRSKFKFILISRFEHVKNDIVISTKEAFYGFFGFESVRIWYGSKLHTRTRDMSTQSYPWPEARSTDRTRSYGRS